MKRVLLATDGSESALKAARFLNSMAATHAELKVAVVTVVPVPQPIALATMAGTTYVPDVPVDAMVQNEAEPILERTLEVLGLDSERVTKEVLVGAPAEELCRLARAEHYDMIVLGNRGLNPIKEFLMGSVSDRCLHLAPCPVLIVK